MDIKVTLNIAESTGTIESYSADDQANTSRLSQLAIPSLGAKLFYLSKADDEITSPLDGEHLYADETVGYSGWVSNSYSNADGSFTKGQEPTITINGKNIKTIVLYGDVVEQHFVELAEVNGLTYTGYEEKLIISLDDEADSVTIKILKLNEPYQPVKITGIETSLTLDFENEEIVSYDFGSQSQSSDDSIEYSVVSRYGSIDFDNNSKIFNNLNDLDLLDNDLKADVYVNNKKFGEYILRVGDLKYGDSVASFDLNDELMDFDQIGWNKSYYMDENVSAKTFLDNVFNHIGRTYNIYDDLTQSVLTKTMLNNVITDDDNVKDLLISICGATQCVMFKNNAGQIVIKYLEPTNAEVT